MKNKVKDKSLFPTCLLGALLFVLCAKGMTGCAPGQQTDNPNIEEGYICPVLQDGTPQSTGLNVSVSGYRCIERVDGTKNCGHGPLLASSDQSDPLCVKFVDGAQVVTVEVTGPCFGDYSVAGVDISNDPNSTHKPVLSQAGAEMICDEAENGEIVPMCGPLLTTWNDCAAGAPQCPTGKTVAAAQADYLLCCDEVGDVDFNEESCFE